MKDFFHNLNHLWGDIGLSDFIMSKVNNELTQNEMREVQTPTVAARYFLPLLKITTKSEAGSPESLVSNKKVKKTANVLKSALNFDSLNLQGINLLFEQVDKVITSTNEVRSFQYVAKFAIIILEVSSSEQLEDKNNTYITDSENLNNDGKVGIRVVEPAAVLYEVLLNVYLILVMLRKVAASHQATAENFLLKGFTFFQNFWCDELKDCCEFFFGICSKVWESVSRTPAAANTFVKVKNFTLATRTELYEKWKKTVVHKIASMKPIRPRAR